MRCPACALEHPEGAVECTRCGLEFAQWMGKREDHLSQPAGAAGRSQPIAASRPAPTRAVSASGGIVTCTKCRFQHRPRPDGKCPRCHAVLAPSLLPLPDHSPRHASFATENLGILISGAYFVLAAVIGLLNRDNLPAGSALYVGVGINLVIGIGLLGTSSASRSFRRAASIGLLFLGVVGLLLLGAAALAVLGKTGWALVGLGVAIANGILIFGRVSILRIVLVSTYLGLALAFGAWVSTRNTHAMELAYKLARTVEGQPVTEVKGRSHDYQLRLPPSARWFEARKQPLRADRVLISPVPYAMLSITVEQMPKPQIDLRDVGDGWLKHLRSVTTSFKVSSFEEVAREELPLPADGLLLHVRYVEGSRSFTMLTAILRKDKTLYTLNTFTPTADYPSLADELRAMIASFVPGNELPAVALPVSTPASAPPSTPADRQAACRRSCQSSYDTCFCPRYEANCKESCTRDLRACLSGCSQWR
jgi:hypothetical protein